jgi:hypothetical protein
MEKWMYCRRKREQQIYLCLSMKISKVGLEGGKLRGPVPANNSLFASYYYPFYHILGSPQHPPAVYCWCDSGLYSNAAYPVD